MGMAPVAAPELEQTCFLLPEDSAMIIQSAAATRTLK
jgi:hypothetical protein